ncbi:MAG: FAD-dependent oxidoreductase [Clostridia bacterium]|jgi:NADPH-dependent 2,4-dienoyl-CoA reductase/sulfur reductase-like enzyme|nr:FAD-dependent oxidoreductase [Clostridia bacterium]MBT7123436.1 FAD-dependent oxidoreductase [Clostridia bacterium]
MKADVAVIGAGPAGLAAAIAAKENGAKRVVVLDREAYKGGILPQCIHNGFGLHIFGEELTGPEYAARYIDMADNAGVTFMMETMVLSIDEHKVITAVGKDVGITTIEAKAIVLAMGCRERSSGALMLPGDRPAGVMSAGTAQRFVNMEGYMPGKDVVILGSGDIGLIMARRMTLEGANVKMVLELMPYSGGLTRNIVQCLDDFDIPLKLSHTVVKMHGKQRLTGVTIAKVDENLNPIESTSEFVSCDTLLLSVGLIPENELAMGLNIQMDSVTGGAVVDSDMQTSMDGVFACGNALQVHDLVDFVTEEASRAGKAAAQYKKIAKLFVNTIAGSGVRYVVPQKLVRDGIDKTLFFRATKVTRGWYTIARCRGKIIASRKRVMCAPGEMENLVIKDADISGGVTVTIEETKT